MVAPRIISRLETKKVRSFKKRTGNRLNLKKSEIITKKENNSWYSVKIRNKK